MSKVTQERLNICGEVTDIFYDKDVRKLNLELVKDKIGTPMIIFQNWTGRKCTNLLTLHIKEAIELKSIIDKLVLDYTEHLIEGED